MALEAFDRENIHITGLTRFAQESTKYSVYFNLDGNKKRETYFIYTKELLTPIIESFTHQESVSISGYKVRTDEGIVRVVLHAVRGA